MIPANVPIKEALSGDMEVNVVYSVCACVTKRDVEIGDVEPEAFVGNKNQTDENYFH